MSTGLWVGLAVALAPAAMAEDEGSLEDYIEGEAAPADEEENGAPTGEDEEVPAEEEEAAPEGVVVPEPEPEPVVEPEPEPVVEPEPEPEPVVEPEPEPESVWQEPEPAELPVLDTSPSAGFLATLRPRSLRPWQGFTSSLLLELGGMGTAFSVAWWWSERGDTPLYSERLAWAVLVPSLAALGATGGVWLQGGRFGGRTGLGAVMGVGAGLIWLGAGVGIGTLMARQDNEYAWIAFVGGSALALVSPAAGATVGGLWTDKDGGRKLFGMPMVLPDGQGGAMPGLALTGSWR